MLSEKIIKQLNELLPRFADKRSAVLPALYAIQQEQGYVSHTAMQDIAEFLTLEPIEVQATASYYSMFYQQPVGKYVIQVCNNISCALLGADHLIKYLEQKLQIQVKQTTPDNKFTLLTVECLGGCDKAPVMMINEKYYTNLTPEKIDSILASLP